MQYKQLSYVARSARKRGRTLYSFLPLTATTTKHTTLFQNIQLRTNIATARNVQKKILQLRGKQQKEDALDLLSYTWVWRMSTKRDFLPDANDRTVLLSTIHHPVISQLDTKTDTVASTLAHHSQRKEIPPYGNPHGTNSTFFKIKNVKN